MSVRKWIFAGLWLYGLSIFGGEICWTCDPNIYFDVSAFNDKAALSV